MTLPQQNTASARSTSFYYLMCQLDRVQYPAMTQALLKLRLMMTSYKQYIPDRQDLIWINFKPSVRQEIRGRHPAIVISSVNYSRLTGLVMVMPITHGTNNRLKSLFIPLHAQKLGGIYQPVADIHVQYWKAQCPIHWWNSLRRRLGTRYINT